MTGGERSRECFLIVKEDRARVGRDIGSSLGEDGVKGSLIAEVENWNGVE